MKEKENRRTIKIIENKNHNNEGKRIPTLKKKEYKCHSSHEVPAKARPVATKVRPMATKVRPVAAMAAKARAQTPPLILVRFFRKVEQKHQFCKQIRVSEI